MTETFQSFMPETGLPAPEATVFIYALNDPVTGKCRYVGKATNPRRRFGKHLLRARESSTHKNCWIRGLAAKGLQPILEVLDEVPATQWKFWEQEYIRVFRMIGFNLTNLTDGGEGTVGLTEESREKIRVAAKKRTWSPEMREKMKHRAPPSAEARAVWSQSCREHLAGWNRGVPSSEETRRKISVSNLGRRHTEESKRKNSESHMGLRPSEATREKLRNKVISAETRAKISASKLGKKLGPRKPKT